MLKRLDKNLTEAEIEVFKLLSQGYTRKEIADKVNRTPMCVQQRLNQAYKRLDSKSVVHAAIILERKGLLK